MRGENGGVQAQRDALGKTLIGIAKTHNKFYCWATRETLCLLMSKYHDTNISSRTLSRRLTEMHKEGYIIRQMRTRPDGNGGKRFNCNLYYLTKKLLLWVKKLGEYARKVFSFFREPTLAHNSSLREEEICKKFCSDVEIIKKPGVKCRDCAF